MGIILSGLWQDPRSTLIGTLRRLVRRADGFPRPNDTAQRLQEIARSVRYIPAELDGLVRDYPGYPEPLFERALVQIEDNQWEAVLATAEYLVQRFGSHLLSYRLTCGALRQFKRYDEAETLAITAIRRFPNGVAAWEAYAQVAQEQGDMVTAERRWAIVARRFPKVMWPRLMVATCRAANGDREEADRLLRILVDDFPDEYWVLHHYADMAERRGDFAAAAARWGAVMQKIPGQPGSHERMVKALLQAGDLRTAVERLDSAAFMFPRDPGLLSAREMVITAGGKLAPLPGS
ncbi:MAG: tetratricopeptide repeat protein [Alphaproteobacteria bacterium]|nr:tetratricopeptide repeat protein [Alphaproteobacteria bacterium]